MRRKERAERAQASEANGAAYLRNIPVRRFEHAPRHCETPGLQKRVRRRPEGMSKHPMKMKRGPAGGSCQAREMAAMEALLLTPDGGCRGSEAIGCVCEPYETVGGACGAGSCRDRRGRCRP